MDRREFMINSGLAVGGTFLASQKVYGATRRKITKSLKMGMIKREDENGKPLSIEARLAIAKNSGFESVEPDTIFSTKQLKEYATASEKLDFPIDGIVCSTHWGSPLTDPDPDVYNKTIKGMRTSMENCKELGGDMVLLVPAVVNPKVRYIEAYERAVERTKILAEDAERMDLTIGIENVWNKFLLSPLEAKQFIEDIGSKRVQFWFDVGNVVQFGYPEDWIRTLGDQICRVDVKDFKRETNKFVPLMKGSVDWRAVMKAFDEIKYEGVFAAEVSGGNQQYLTDMVSKPMDTFLAY
jgi:hexulose-6-phosphate isomerase